MKELELKLDTKGFTNIPHEILMSSGLKTEEKIIYCTIRKFSAEGKKAFMSNAYLAKLLNKKLGVIKGYLKTLEDQKLISRGMQNSKRILYAHNWNDRQYSERQSVDCPPVVSDLTTTSQNSDHTIDSALTRYNTVNNTVNNTVDIPKEPLLVDNEVKVKNKLVMNKDKRKKWEGRYLYTRFSMSQQPGWRDLIDNLSDEELTQFEEYSDSLHPNEYGYKLTDVINNRLFVRQKQT